MQTRHCNCGGHLITALKQKLALQRTYFSVAIGKAQASSDCTLVPPAKPTIANHSLVANSFTILPRHAKRLQMLPGKSAVGLGRLQFH